MHRIPLNNTIKAKRIHPSKILDTEINKLFHLRDTAPPARFPHDPLLLIMVLVRNHLPHSFPNPLKPAKFGAQFGLKAFCREAVGEGEISGEGLGEGVRFREGFTGGFFRECMEGTVDGEGLLSGIFLDALRVEGADYGFGVSRWGVEKDPAYAGVLFGCVGFAQGEVAVTIDLVDQLSHRISVPQLNRGRCGYSLELCSRHCRVDSFYARRGIICHRIRRHSPQRGRSDDLLLAHRLIFLPLTIRSRKIPSRSSPIKIHVIQLAGLQILHKPTVKVATVLYQLAPRQGPQNRVVLFAEPGLVGVLATKVLCCPGEEVLAVLEEDVLHFFWRGLCFDGTGVGRFVPVAKVGEGNNVV